VSLNEKEQREYVWLKWALNPWLWIMTCCWTVDEADKGQIKRFPEKDYLGYVVDVWMRESLLAIPKSRRMLMTWLLLALHLWAALFRSNSAIFIQSKKEEDSEFLLGDQRLMFIYSHLPSGYPWPTITRQIRGKGGVNRLEFSNGSYIMAVAEGPDQLRQYTASYVYATEMAFWDRAEATWTALKPTVTGGGKITIDSSAGPGFLFDFLLSDGDAESRA
jgi:phage FluMu gp28-like protein